MKNLSLELGETGQPLFLQMLDSWPESILDFLNKLLIVVRKSGLALILTKKIKIRARINFSRAVVRTINLTLASSGHQQVPVVVTIRLKAFWEFLGLHLRVWEAKKKKKYTKVSWTKKRKNTQRRAYTSVFTEGNTGTHTRLRGVTEHEM